MKYLAILLAVVVLHSVALAETSSVVTITGRPDFSASSVKAIYAGEVDVLKRSAYEEDMATLHYSALQKSMVAQAINIPFFSVEGTGSFGELDQAIEAAQNHGQVIFAAARSSVGSNEPVCAKMKSYPQKVFVMPAGADASSAVDLQKEPSCLSPNILIVAAASGKNLAYFSNYGQGIRIAAQGVNLNLEAAGGKFIVVSGTSYPAAMVAGRLAVFALGSSLVGADLVQEFLEKNTEVTPTLSGKVEGSRLLREDF